MNHGSNDSVTPKNVRNKMNPAGAISVISFFLCTGGQWKEDCFDQSYIALIH